MRICVRPVFIGVGLATASWLHLVNGLREADEQIHLGRPVKARIDDDVEYVWCLVPVGIANSEPLSCGSHQWEPRGAPYISYLIVLFPDNRHAGFAMACKVLSRVQRCA